jgi:hypothetical protein
MHNRLNERRQLKQKLEAGVSIHMPAPRRIGKTWTISRLAADLRADNWTAIEIDVQGMNAPEQFAGELCKRIEGQTSISDRFKLHAAQRFKNLIGGNWTGSPLEALGQVDPIQFAETLIAALDETGNKIAIIIDEIAYFFLELAKKDVDQAKAFAYQLRAIQGRHKSVRWLLTGSIGLDTIARRYGLEGAFVDFDTFTLEPFSSEEARSFMRAPDVQQQFTHRFDASDDDFKAMFVELGWLAPYYLKTVANEVRPSQVGSAPPIATKADFDAAFEKLLLPNRKSAFAVWREHIEKNLPREDSELAKHLLDKLSVDPAGEKVETLLADAQQHLGGATLRHVRDVLAMLNNDGLVSKIGDRHAFQSGLVRRYWQEYEAN